EYALTRRDSIDVSTIAHPLCRCGHRRLIVTISGVLVVTGRPSVSTLCRECRVIHLRLTPVDVWTNRLSRRGATDHANCGYGESASRQTRLDFSRDPLKHFTPLSRAVRRLPASRSHS